MAKDWRLQGQENYLKGAELKWVKWRQTRKNWDHDHCAFCWKEFCDKQEDEESLKEGYATLDEYHWICKKCFEDFKNMFNWKVKES